MHNFYIFQSSGSDEWVTELKILKALNAKAELEALTYAPRFLVDVYLRNKLNFYLEKTL